MADVPQILAGTRGVVMGVSGENSIGYRCAAAMIAMGAEVLMTSRPARGTSIALLAERLGARFAPVDVDDDATIAAMCEGVNGAWGRLDFLLHTVVHVPAGLLEGRLLDVSRAQFNRVLEVGVHSLVASCRHALPLLRASRSPRVVTLTSASDHLMTPHYHVAGIAKGALAATVLYLAHELGPYGVLCNAVSTSLLATDGAVRAVGEQNALATRAVLAKKAPTRRPVEFGDVANCVAWMCSPWVQNVTGEIVTVDGGFSRTYF